jgi:hemerythrin-like domain-containing protein
VTIDRGLRQDASAENVAKFTRKAIDMYDLELTNHFEIEEKFVFPAVEPHPLVDELIGQHRHVEALIARMRMEPSSELLQEFAELLRAHIRCEENELFQDIQKRLPRETLDRLGKEIDAMAVRICL